MKLSILTRRSDFAECPKLPLTDSGYWIKNIHIFENIRAVGMFSICFHHAFSAGLFNIIGGKDQLILVAMDRVSCLIALPLFAFASGFGQNRPGDVQYFVRLLSIYIGALLINIPYHILRVGALNESAWLTHFIIGPPGITGVYLWYLVALPVWKAITPVFLRIKIPIVGAFLIGLVVYPDLEALAYAKGITENSSFLDSILRPVIYMIRFYPFYLIGVLTVREDVIRLRQSFLKYGLLLLGMFGVYFAASGDIKYHLSIDVFRVNAFFYYLFSLACLGSMMGFIPGRFIGYATVLGQGSFAIYLFHYLLIRLTYLGLSVTGVDLSFFKGNQFWILFLSSFITLTICRVASIKAMYKKFMYLSDIIQKNMFKLS